jgi:hypothetical protein
MPVLAANGARSVGKFGGSAISLLENDDNPSIAFAYLECLLVKLNQLSTHLSSDAVSIR